MPNPKITFFDTVCVSPEIIPGSLEHAYLCILNDDLDSAKKIFSTIDSPRGLWGKIFCEILNSCLENYPTYFLIRNFLEIDLDFLIKNEKLDYAEQFLGSLELLAGINQETYKFAARVMYANNLLSVAFSYMEKSKKLYYNDPELHFMLAKYYNDIHDTPNAYISINECLRILPDYYPAKLMKEQIEEKLF